MNILVSAGPTREYIDPIRFISNRSSGRMGYAVAQVALDHGHSVTLVSGPVSINPPDGVDVVQVVSAEGMHCELLSKFPHCDALVMTAAVSDFTFPLKEKNKISRTDEGLKLNLVPVPDILAGFGSMKDKQMIIGFALETGNAEERAKQKMYQKNCDLIVLNGPEAIDSETITASLLFRDGGREEVINKRKAELAERLIEIVEQLTTV